MKVLRPLNIIISHGPELINAGLDPWEFSLQVAGLSRCRVLLLDPALPEPEQQARLDAFLYDKSPQPMIVAAMDPERRAAGTLRLLREKFRINPDLLAQVDLQAALEHPRRRSRTKKGLELINLTAAQVLRAQPITSQEVPVSTRVLVWGDSLAALTAARDLAAAGYPVILAAPGAGLRPLDPEAPQVDSLSEPLAELVQEVRSHPGIQILTNALMVDLAGEAGNFTVRLETSPGQQQEERVGALILAPELTLAADPGLLGLVDHPGVLPQGQLEELLTASPEDLAGRLGTAAGEAQVALLAGFAPVSPPAALHRALTAAGRLLKLENLRVLLLLGHARVADPGLEAALRQAQDAGLIVYKLQEPPRVAPAEDLLKLTFFDPVMFRSAVLNVNLLAYEEEYQAAPENAALAGLLQLPLAPRGFLQGDNVHLLPVATLRRGIYVAGSGRGVMSLSQAAAEAQAAALEVRQLLVQGMALAPQGRAVVDRARCVLCLTCYRLCPHRAISYDNRAVISELACQGCGVCASECPNDAIQIYNYTDEQIVAAFDAFDYQLTPRIVAYLCQNSAWEAYQAALKLKHAALPLGFTAMKMPCAGKIDPFYLLKAFTRGAAGVLVLACHPDNCKSHRGNQYAAWRVELTQNLLAEAGIDPRRLQYRTLAANSPQDFLDGVADLLASLEAPPAA